MENSTLTTAGLRHNRLHHFAGNIREPEIAASVAIGQLFVIETEQVQHGRMEVVDARAIFGGLETELICRAINDAALHPAAREPHAEAVMIVIAAKLGLAAVAKFDGWSAPK